MKESKESKEIKESKDSNEKSDEQKEIEIKQGKLEEDRIKKSLYPSLNYLKNQEGITKISFDSSDEEEEEDEDTSRKEKAETSAEKAKKHPLKYIK